MNSGNLSMLAAQMAVTFGKAGAVLIEDGRFLFARPPRIFDINPIGAGDAFAAAYIRSLFERCKTR